MPFSSTIQLDSALTPTGSTGQLTCEFVRDFHRLEELAPEWQRLWKADLQAEAFQNFAWIRAFWAAYGPGLSLCSVVVYEDDNVIGILPLAQSKGVIQFLGTPETDYNDLLCEEADAAKVLRAGLTALLQSRWKWHTCALDNLPECARITRYWDALPASLQRHLRLIRCCPCPTILLKDNRAETMRALLQKESPRRHQKKLEKLGRLSFRHLESKLEIHQHLETFFQQHIQRHAMNGDRSQFLRPLSRVFYRALVEELDPSTDLRFGVVELDGRAIAYHLGFACNGKFTWYKPAFCVDYWEHSPGEVLLRKLLEYANEQGSNEFDFTIGDEGFKSRFSNHVRYNYALYIEARPGSIGALGRNVLRDARVWLKTNPRALQFVRSLFAKANEISHLWQSSGLLEWLRNTASTMLKQIVSVAHEMVFCALPSAATAASELELVPGSLSDLASLSVEYPQWFPAAKLHEFRERFKRDDRVHLVRKGDSVVHVAWSGVRNEIEIAGQKIPLNPPGVLIYDIFTVPAFRRRGMHAELMRVLRLHFGEKPLWTCCHRGEITGIQEMEQAGFHLRHHLVHIAVLSRFRRTWNLTRDDKKHAPKADVLQIPQVTGAAPPDGADRKKLA